MDWFKYTVGLLAITACVPAFLAYQLVEYGYAQQRCDAEGDVCYGIQVQMVADIFKEKFGRYPTIGELTNILDITVEAVPITTSHHSPARWYYDENSGEISVNTNGKYHA